MATLLILINLCIVLIWDIFRAPQEIADSIAELLTKGKIHSVHLRKPWGCSLCMTFWTSLIITLIFCERSLEGYVMALFISLVNAYLTTYTYQFILLGEKILNKIINYINMNS